MGSRTYCEKPMNAGSFGVGEEKTTPQWHKLTVRLTSVCIGHVQYKSSWARVATDIVASFPLWLAGKAPFHLHSPVHCVYYSVQPVTSTKAPKKEAKTPLCASCCSLHYPRDHNMLILISGRVTIISQFRLSLFIAVYAHEIYSFRVHFMVAPLANKPTFIYSVLLSRLSNLLHLSMLFCMHLILATIVNFIV